MLEGGERVEFLNRLPFPVCLFLGWEMSVNNSQQQQQKKPHTQIN